MLGLVTFREGEADPELLGYVHPHGNGLDWRAERYSNDTVPAIP